MTLSLITGPLNPSLSDLNSLIRQMNALFVNVSVAGDSAVSGNLAVTGNSALTGTLAVTGATTMTGALTANGGIVGGASANIAINTNKFTVAASSGNTLIAGTLAVTGASALTGALTVSALTSLTGLALDAATTISAAGTTRTDATALTKSVNNVTTALASTGVTLPASASFGIAVVNNLGANAIQVYGNGSDTIDGAAGTTGVTLTNTKRAIFVKVAANTWISLMGIPAA